MNPLPDPPLIQFEDRVIPSWGDLLLILAFVAVTFAFTFWAVQNDPPEPKCQRDAAKLGATGVYVAHKCWATYENQEPVRLW